MHPTLQSPPHRKEILPLTQKLSGTMVTLAIETAKKEIRAYLQNPIRTECERFLAQTMLDVVEGFSEKTDHQEIIRRLDEFFVTVKDYENLRAELKDSYESRIEELTQELDAARKAKGTFPFTADQLEAKIMELGSQKEEAIEIQVNAEDELKKAEGNLRSFKKNPSVGIGTAKFAQKTSELEEACTTRANNLLAIQNTVAALTAKINNLRAIQQSLKVLSTATLD